MVDLFRIWTSSAQDDAWASSSGPPAFQCQPWPLRWLSTRQWLSGRRSSFVSLLDFACSLAEGRLAQTTQRGRRQLSWSRSHWNHQWWFWGTPAALRSNSSTHGHSSSTSPASRRTWASPIFLNAFAFELLGIARSSSGAHPAYSSLLVEECLSYAIIACDESLPRLFLASLWSTYEHSPFWASSSHLSSCGSWLESPWHLQACLWPSYSLDC